MNGVLMVIVVIIIIVIITGLTSLSSESKYLKDHRKEEKHVLQRRSNKNRRNILYSYGLFSDEPMPETMRDIIRKNGRVTHLDHVVLGLQEVQRDIQELMNSSAAFDSKVMAIYNSIPRGVSKSDLARLIHLYVRGGHYADLDVEFHQVPVIGDDVILYTENYAILPRIANYAISSPPRHPFILAVIKEVVARVIKKVQETEGVSKKDNPKNQTGKKMTWSDDDVLQTTGPDVITDVYRSWHQGGVKRIGLINSKRILTHKADGSWRGGK